MKNGVLSNFTRSQISSDKVRSGFEIRSVHERGFTAGQKTVENPGLGRGPPGQAFGLAGRSRAAGRGPRVCFLQNPSNKAAA